MLNLLIIAESKAQSSKEDLQAWQKAIQNAYKILSQQPMSDSEIELLVTACSTVKVLNLLSREFFNAKKSDPERKSFFHFLQKEVDESEFSLEQWIEAIEFLYDWLKKEKKSADFKTICGYLNCCAVAPENKLYQRRLVSIVNEFIDKHGFERAINI